MADVDDDELQMDRDDADARVGDRVAQYRIRRVLGVGGMATVFEVENERTGFAAAMKVLHARFARQKGMAERFAAEAQTWKVVGHPGVAKVVDAGHDPTVGPYLVMELLTGATLRDWMQGKSSREVMPVLLEALRPLAAAHANGVIHRDVKPENVFVTLTNGMPDRVILLDFGIARVRKGTAANPRARTRTGTRFGTLAYVSPEQAKDSKDAGPPSDVWSVGVILFEILTGRSPIAQTSTGEIYAELFSPAPLPRVRDLAPTVSARWQRLTDLCLDKDPNERPSIEELLDVLPDLLDELASAGTSPSEPRPSPLPAARHPRAPTDLVLPALYPAPSHPPAQAPTPGRHLASQQPIGPFDPAPAPVATEPTGGRRPPPPRFGRPPPDVFTLPSCPACGKEVAIERWYCQHCFATNNVGEARSQILDANGTRPIVRGLLGVLGAIGVLGGCIALFLLSSSHRSTADMESAISLAIVFLSAVSVAGAFAFDRAPRAFSLVLVLMSVPVLLYVPFFGCFAFLAVAGAGVVGTLAGYEASKLRTTW